MLDLPEMGFDDDWQLDVDFDLADFDMSDGEDGLVPYLYEQLDDGRLQVAFASIHSKLVTIETQAGNKIVMHGSANLRSSRNLEHICIQQDDELFDFVESVGRRIMEAYGTINKSGSLRGGKLWRAVRAGEKAGRTGARRPTRRSGA